MLAEVLFSVITVQEKDVPTALFIFWGAVIIGGILSLMLISAGSNPFDPKLHNAGRFIGRIALLALVPAVTLSCSVMSG